MAFLKVDLKNVKDYDGEGSNYIYKPGLYDVIIHNIIVNKSKVGRALTLDFFVDYNNQPQILYGNLRIFNNDGNENKIGSKLANDLMVCLGIEELEDPEPMSLPIGKDGEFKEVMVIPNVEDEQITLELNIEYSVYNSDIKEKKIIKRFFNGTTHQSPEELINKKDPELYDKIAKKYEENPQYGYIYKDGLTKESIEEWIKAGRPKNSASKKTNESIKEKAKRLKFGK